MFKKTVIFWLVMILGLSMIFSGCSKGTDAAKEDTSPKTVKNQIVMATEHELDSLDPHIASSAGTKEILFNIYEGLLKPDSEGNLIPAVASEYSISDDGLVYSFTLREGIKFHDDTYVTVEDIKYSLERLKGSITGSPLTSDFDKVSEIKVIDEKTVEIILEELDSSMLSKLIAPILPKSNEGTFADNPIGTGPFMFDEYLPGQRVVLKKFDNYWNEGLPYLSKVEFRIVPDIASGLMSFRAGEIDIYPRLPNDKIDELGGNYTLISGPQNLVQLMIMNNARKPLDDMGVRKAINYAVDVDEIIEAVAFGYGSKIGTNMSPVMGKFYNAELENRYDVDIEKAKKLLEEAGYEDGFDITIAIPSNYQFHVDTGVVISEQLKRVGINAEIKLVEWGVWLEDIYKKRDYDMTIVGFSGKLDPHRILYRYYSDYKKNMMNYSNKEFDVLLDQAIGETDLNKRAELYLKAQELLSEDAPCVYIMDPQFTVAMKKEVQGYKMYPIYVQDMSIIKWSDQ